MSESYFFEDYAEARRRFRAACEAAGSAADARVNPHAQGPGGEELALDFARFGDPGARRVLVAICGTHGPEGPTGSATMLRWIEERRDRALPDGVAVLFAHGLNAYGWAHTSRTNENNVDLNRNFLEHTNHPPNPIYGELHELLITEEMSDAILDEARGRYAEYLESHDHAAVIEAINQGQYEWPTGLFYGGAKPEWSHATLRAELRDRLAGCSHVGLIDWHTGLGEFGRPLFLCFSGPDSPAFREACRWWGDDNIRHEEGYEGAPRPEYRGLLVNAVEDDVTALGARLGGAAIEFGTYPMDQMLGALLMDRWLRFACKDPRGAEADAVRKRIWGLFCPPDPEWRSAVIRESSMIYDQAVEGLAGWA